MLYPLENFIVNMADSGGTRYLRVTLQLELDDTKKVRGSSGYEKASAKRCDTYCARFETL